MDVFLDLNSRLSWDGYRLIALIDAIISGLLEQWKWGGHYFYKRVCAVTDYTLLRQTTYKLFEQDFPII